MLDFTPVVVEPLSTDDAFLGLSGTRCLRQVGAAAELAALARLVEDALSITTSIGFSYNRLLSKFASDFDKLRGCIVNGRAEAQLFLPAPRRDVPPALRGQPKPSRKTESGLSQ